MTLRKVGDNKKCRVSKRGVNWTVQTKKGKKVQMTSEKGKTKWFPGNQVCYPAK